MRTVTASDIRGLKPLFDAAARGDIPERIVHTCGGVPEFGGLCSCGVWLRPGIRTMEPAKTIVSTWADMQWAWVAARHENWLSRYVAENVLEARYEDMVVLWEWALGEGYVE